MTLDGQTIAAMTRPFYYIQMKVAIRTKSYDYSLITQESIQRVRKTALKSIAIDSIQNTTPSILNLIS
jgi:hypothetical protein